MVPLAADECVSGHIVSALISRGVALITVSEAELDGSPDPDILEWAAARGRVLVTQDVNTMIGFAWQRVDNGLPMPGLIVVDKITVQQAVEELVVASECGLPEDFENQVRYLPL